MREFKLIEEDLTILPPIPADVTHLYCERNNLTSLPTILPSGLVYLSCGDNMLTELPASLPAGLKNLDCYNNRLSSLPLLPWCSAFHSATIRLSLAVQSVGFWAWAKRRRRSRGSSRPGPTTLPPAAGASHRYLRRLSHGRSQKWNRR